jgi:hypothetical protein
MLKKDDLTVAAPCNVDWQKMTLAEGGRFCGDCKKVVRDLSTMRERDARALLRSPDNGELCVRYLYDKHGKVFFAGDRAAPLVPASFLQRAKRLALSAAAVAVPLSLAACSPSSGATAGAPASHDEQELREDEVDENELTANMGTMPYDPNREGIDGGDAGPDAEPDGGDAIDGGPQGDGGAPDAEPDASPGTETPI